MCVHFETNFKTKLILNKKIKKNQEDNFTKFKSDGRDKFSNK